MLDNGHEPRYETDESEHEAESGAGVAAGAKVGMQKRKWEGSG